MFTPAVNKFRLGAQGSHGSTVDIYGAEGAIRE